MDLHRGGGITGILGMATSKDYKSLGKRKILLAEDVELNQQLAKRIMESWGFEVFIAADGLEALDMVQKDKFDLLLMDIQMPEMDGMEATRQIRSLADLSVASIPIVALTANVHNGDPEKYLAIGMNDCLAKPFDEEKLFNIISKNLQSKSNAVMMEKPEPLSAPSPGPAKKLYDLSMIESVSGGDAGFIQKMLQLLLSTMPGNLVELKELLQNKQWETLGRLAHKMKSTIDSLGISRLHEDIRLLESHGKKQEHLEEIPALVDTVVRVMEQCLAQLKKDFNM